MRASTLVSVSVLAIAVAVAVGPVSAAEITAKEQSAKPVSEVSSKSAPAASQFAALRNVKTAVPMTKSELDKVKGLHVHFLDGNGGFHLAGDVHSGNFTQWKNRGGSDGLPVAPSYNGLCIAQGVGGDHGISIPGAGVECP